MAAATLDEALAPLIENPEQTAVLLDVDGTLAPIVRHADDAHVPEPVRTLLIAIAARYGLVACISGRRAAAARRMVGLGTITYVGNHGAEILRAGETAPEISPEIGAWVTRVHDFDRQMWEELDLQRLRIRGEDKELIVSFHWRGVPDERAAEIAIEEMQRRARAAGLATHRGRMVLEIRPDVPFGKDVAVARLLERDDIDRALYMGDDRTDADAFLELHAALDNGRLAHAACIGVASEETPLEVEHGADVLVDGPDGAREVLLQLAKA